MDYKFGCVIEIDIKSEFITKEPYVLACVGGGKNKFTLISIIDGSCWSKSQFFSGEVKEEDLLFYLKDYSFNKVADSVEEYYRSLL